MATDTLYFEDFRIGRRWHLEPYTFTPEEIVDFAVRWDPQPYHVDADAARDSTFGELVASGIHTLATFVRLQHDALFSHTAAAAGLGLDAVRFHGPVRPGRPVHGEVEVLQATTREGGRPWGRVVFGLRFTDDAGAPLLTGENHVLIWRRPAEAR